MLIVDVRIGKQKPTYRIPQLKLPLDHSQSAVVKKICAMLGIRPNNLVSWTIVKKSFDACEPSEIRIIYEGGVG
jgi:hypothetical protein